MTTPQWIPLSERRPAPEDFGPGKRVFLLDTHPRLERWHTKEWEIDVKDVPYLEKTRASHWCVLEFPPDPEPRTKTQREIDEEKICSLLHRPGTIEHHVDAHALLEWERGEVLAKMVELEHVNRFGGGNVWLILRNWLKERRGE